MSPAALFASMKCGARRPAWLKGAAPPPTFSENAVDTKYRDMRSTNRDGSLERPIE
jgi:hypothetical protein